MPQTNETTALHAHRQRELLTVMLLGALLGAALGALGVGMALSVLTAVPVLLAPVPLLGYVGWWYARRRLAATPVAVAFAAALAVAQWPFAWWVGRSVPRGAVPDPLLSVVLMMLVGLALAPMVIVLLRRRTADRSRRPVG
ncbi:MAG: hypothetical protein U5K74_12465 [Gemmatimonadaceae bacterium]|nr:hypothetical protein [Gemmatimonadaceae bacterium]